MESAALQSCIDPDATRAMFDTRLVAGPTRTEDTPMTPDPDPKTTDEDDSAAPEADIDRASEESFPASDPPSYGAPETGGDRD